jgi:amidohydrolase
MDGLPEFAELVALRRELHAHPELAGEETGTSRILRRFVESHEPHRLVTGLGGAGLAAVYDGRDEGPVVMFRAEIDAVPVHEDNDVDHRSRRSGVAHACGHDGHMAIAAGLAAWLHRHPPRRGRVVLLFQPAEETGAGALSVLEDPRFDSIAPDWIFALHNLPGEDIGEVQIKAGSFAAGSVGSILRFQGTTSHAAYPEQGRSPALAVAQLIQELIELPDRVDAGQRIARLTVVHARIGEAAFGTTPGEAEVMATLRSDREEILDRLRAGVVERAQRIAQAHGLAFSHSWTDVFPVTMNDPEAVAMVEAVAETGGITVTRRDEAYPWSEDFGWFTQRFKGAIFGLGAGREHPALHSPGYDFPDDLIPLGLGLFMGLIEKLLGSRT